MQKMTATQRTALAIVTTARAHATMGLAIVFLIAANWVGAIRVNAGAIPATVIPNCGDDLDPCMWDPLHARLPRLPLRLTAVHVVTTAHNTRSTFSTLPLRQILQMFDGVFVTESSPVSIWPQKTRQRGDRPGWNALGIQDSSKPVASPIPWISKPH